MVSVEPRRVSDRQGDKAGKAAVKNSCFSAESICPKLNITIML